jgi:hypothetical protein
MIPATSPAPVMISMENSNAYANDRPFWTVARPIRRPRKTNPTSVPLKTRYRKIND